MELKKRMTVEEMTEHMQENTCIIPNRSSVGRYAKKLGYKVYKPMVEGKIRLFYVNEQIINKPTKNIQDDENK